VCAVTDYENSVIDGCRAIRTGVYATRIHLVSIKCYDQITDVAHVDLPTTIR